MKRPNKTFLFITAILLLITLLIPVSTEVIKLIDSNNSYFIEREFIDGNKSTIKIVPDTSDQKQTKIFGQNINFPLLFYTRLALIFFVVIVTFIVQYFQVYKPFIKITDLRERTFEITLEPSLEVISDDFNNDFRLNIMKSYNILSFGKYFYIKRLKMIYSYGFSQFDLDRDLKFWIIRMFGYKYNQGVCGLAFSEEKSIMGDLRNIDKNSFNASKNIKNKTEMLQFVLSIPIIRWDQNNSYDVVGIINIDSKDAIVAEILSGNIDDVLENYTAYFDDISQYLSFWL